MREIVEQIMEQIANGEPGQNLTKFNLDIKFEEDTLFEISANGNAKYKDDSYTYEILVKINKDL